jgi:hypothetical protein
MYESVRRARFPIRMRVVRRRLASDQKYSRWYPSAIALPNDMILVVGGFDQDNTVPPDPNRVEKGRLNIPQGDTAFTASRVNQVVAEIYDPRTDRARTRAVVIDVAIHWRSKGISQRAANGREISHADGAARA